MDFRQEMTTENAMYTHEQAVYYVRGKSTLVHLLMHEIGLERDENEVGDSCYNGCEPTCIEPNVRSSLHKQWAS